MTRTRRFTLVLDLALLAGLALFCTAWYFRGPNPLWQKPIAAKSVSLGFSADSQKLYVFSDYTLWNQHIPKPTIARWDVKTGTKEAEYPLQVPAEELALIRPYPGEAVCFSAQLFPHEHLLLVRQQSINGPHDSLFRLYDPDDGRNLSKRPVPGRTFDHMPNLIRQAEDGKVIGIMMNHLLVDEPSELTVWDLTTAAKMKRTTWSADVGKATATLLPDGKHVAVVTYSRPSKEEKQYALEVRRFDSWTLVAKKELKRAELGSQLVYLIQPLDATRLAIVTMQSTIESSLFSLDRIDFNPELGALIEDKDMPLQGQPHLGACLLDRDALVHVRFGDASWWKKPGWQWLVDTMMRLGYELPERPRADCFNYDLATGKLRGQLTGLIGSGTRSLLTSPGGRYAVVLEHHDQTPRLTVYAIPHYLWEWTWKTLIYASWLLVVPWPLRIYLARRASGNPPAVAVSSPPAS